MKIKEVVKGINDIDLLDEVGEASDVALRRRKE